MKYVIIIAVVLFLVYNIAKLVKAIIDKRKSKASKKGVKKRTLPKKKIKIRGTTNSEHSNANYPNISRRFKWNGNRVRKRT